MQGGLNLGKAYVPQAYTIRMLSRTEKGMEAGHCIATRACSNDQPDIWNRTERRFSNMNVRMCLMM